MRRTHVFVLDGDGVVWKFPFKYFSSWGLLEELLDEHEKEFWGKKREEMHTDFSMKSHEEYVAYIKEQFKFLKGKNPEKIICNKEIPYTPGFKEFMSFIKRYKDIHVVTVLLSAGFWPIVKKASEEYNFSYVIGNEINFNSSGEMESINVKVTPFNKNQIIKQLKEQIEQTTKNLSHFYLFIDPYEFSIINDNSLLSLNSFNLYLIKDKDNKEIINSNLENKVIVVFNDFNDALEYFKNSKYPNIKNKKLI